VAVSTGLDASWASPEYSGKLAEYRKLSDWEMNNIRVAKPAIYLYPSRDETITVGLGYRGVLTTTAPAIDPATRAWTVRARPDGRIFDETGASWPYLFWEGRGSPRWDMTSGFVFRREDAETFLALALRKLGLSAGESAEFRDYWVPRLQSTPYTLVHFEGAHYERLAPLSVTPQPDTLLRVFMVARPLCAPVAVNPQLLSRPQRNGFTLVEWGGALLPQ
jgi:hypothetical protein